MRLFSFSRSERGLLDWRYLLCMAMIFSGEPQKIFAQLTTEISLVNTPDAQKQTLTHPLVPAQEWVFISLPSSYKPLGVSDNGVALLGMNGSYYRWKAGDIQALNPSRDSDKIPPAQSYDGYTINRQGAIAITWKFSSHVDAVDAGYAYGLPLQRTAEDSFVDFWGNGVAEPVRIESTQFTFTRFVSDSLMSFREQYSLSWFPFGNGVSGDTIRSARAQSVDKNNHVLIYEIKNVIATYPIQTEIYYQYPSTTPTSFFPALQGDLFPSVFEYGNVVFDAASGASSAVSTTSAYYQNGIGTYIFGDNWADFGGYVSRGTTPSIIAMNNNGVAIKADTSSSQAKYYVADQQVSYQPVFINDAGDVLGNLGVLTKIYWHDGTSALIPNEGSLFPGNFTVAGLDDNGRPFGTLGGQPLFWQPVMVGDQMTYERHFYLQLRAPDGWTTDHKVAIDETKIQLGLMTQNSTGQQVPFLAVQASLAVDANRDGAITLSSEDASDATSPDNPFRFWLNDDDDSHVTFQRADNTTPSVDGIDDLKDFFPVFLGIKQLLTVLPPDSGYTYKLKQADDALNFAYTNLTRSTAFSYRNNPNYATSDTRQITVSGMQLDPSFLNAIKNGTQEEGVIICEGNKPSKQPLVLVVEKNGVEVTEVSIQLSIGQDIVLLLHGMNSNVNTWDSFVTHVFGTSPSASASIINGAFLPTRMPDRNASGVRCYRLQAGNNETASTARQGLENLNTSNAMGQNPGNNQLVPYLSLSLVTCGDFETFDELGQEVDDAIALLVARHPNAHIILVGHSRGGLSARAFLENPNYAAEQASVVGCLVTSSPQQGSPMGRIWKYLATPGHRRTEYDSTGQQLMVLDPVQNPDGPISYLPVNYKDWGTVDFLMTTMVGGSAKPFLDVRRPVIMDVADNSDAIQHLNDSTQVANLPGNITYGEIVYKRANFGLIATGQIPDYQGTSLGVKSYSVFGFYNGGNVPNILFKSLSTTTRDFITDNRSPDDINLIGDGLIPAANQVYTTLRSFPRPIAPATSNTIHQLLIDQVLSVHTDAPSRFEDLRQQLHQMEPHWFP